MLFENGRYTTVYFLIHTLSAITQFSLVRHSSSRHYQSMTRWLEVGFGGKLFPSRWPHNPVIRIQFALVSLDTNKLLVDWPGLQHILSQKVVSV